MPKSRVQRWSLAEEMVSGKMGKEFGRRDGEQERKVWVFSFSFFSKWKKIKITRNVV